MVRLTGVFLLAFAADGWAQASRHVEGSILGQRVPVTWGASRQIWVCSPLVFPVVPVFPSITVVELTLRGTIPWEPGREITTWSRRLPQVPPVDELVFLKPQLPPVEPRRLVPGPLLAPPADNDPHAAARREIEEGKEAFAQSYPGRAAERFRRAIQLVPDRAEAHFLLAQAELARGRYRDALIALQEGLRLKPDWPASDFRPIQLYGKHADDFRRDLEQLERALQRSPDDPGLHFLLGYQWWFSGRRNDARAEFQQAERRTMDAEVIRRFLDWPD